MCNAFESTWKCAATSNWKTNYTNSNSTLICNLVKQLLSLAVATGYISISCKGNVIYSKEGRQFCYNTSLILAAYLKTCMHLSIGFFPPLKLP